MALSLEDNALAEKCASKAESMIEDSDPDEYEVLAKLWETFGEGKRREQALHLRDQAKERADEMFRRTSTSAFS